MPIFPWSAARGDVPPVGDPAYDALLEGNHRPVQDGAERLRPVAEAIAALNAPPAATELAAEASALLVFRSGGGSPAEPARSGRRANLLRKSLVSRKLAAAVAASAIALGSVTAAAYAGALPAQVQKFAHDTIGAPPAHRDARPAHPVSPAVPPVPGHNAYGLCTAYAQLKNGDAGQRAAAFRNLAAAAGGAANITAYCAKAAHPAVSPAEPSASHPTHTAGKPATHPTHPTRPSHPPRSPRSPRRQADAPSLSSPHTACAVGRGMRRPGFCPRQTRAAA